MSPLRRWTLNCVLFSSKFSFFFGFVAFFFSVVSLNFLPALRLVAARAVFRFNFHRRKVFRSFLYSISFVFPEFPNMIECMIAWIAKFGEAIRNRSQGERFRKSQIFSIASPSYDEFFFLHAVHNEYIMGKLLLRIALSYTLDMIMTHNTEFFQMFLFLRVQKKMEGTKSLIVIVPYHRSYCFV